jgi:glycosyltransferase involved in cell wall biosynthesis
LETAIEALGVSRSRPTLFLRGDLATGFAQRIADLARRAGVAERVKLLTPVHPAELVRSAAEYDIGLASEPGFSQNNNIAASNKIYTYLLAGLPVVASATPGQQRVAEGAPSVSLYQPGDASDLARVLDELLLSPEMLARARAQAWEAGQKRFNWDVGKAALLEAVAEGARGRCSK